MGDRNNPIKFGPEWLRNLSLERNAGTSNNNSPNQSGPPNFTNSPTISGNMQSSPSGNIASGSSASNTPNIPQNTLAKVLLAKQRFGREEMLALYDKEAEAPPELKQIDVLYQARGKPPIALNNTFEDEMRDNMRSGPSTSGMPPAERFTMSRGGTGRGLNISEGRGRAKLPFIRQVSNVRGGTWHHGTPRMPVYSGGPDEESTLNLRSSWNSSNGGNAAVPNSSDQHWNTPSKMFRSKRQGTPANWRQSREDGEEWRLPDGARSRSTQQEQNKWERDWGDRPQDKQQSWSSNRRTWVGGDTQNDENLPEWAMDNAEACGGTFDSSGAFHGYSNDDSNLPKNQETSFPLTRSHTHGSFVISKTTEDNSDEWWASEKAKKLSPKRFDASDIKFKKQTSTSEASESSIDPKASTSKEEEISEKDDPTTSLEPHDTSTSICDDEKGKKNTYQSKFSRLESMEMLSDMSFGESGDEKGNFQSVIIITPNNILRQKHQNIVSVASEVSKNFESNLSREKQGILHLLQNSPSSQTLENEMRKHQSSEDKIVDDIFEMSLDDKETTIKQQKRIPSPLNHSSANLSAMPSMVNSLPQLPTPGMQLRLSSPAFPTQGLISTKQNIPTSGMPVGMPSGMQGLPAGLQVGMQLPAGLQIGALPPSLQQVTGMQPLGMPPTALQVGNQQSGLQGTSLQPSGMHQSSIPGNIPTPGMQGGLQNSGLPSGLQVSMQPSMQPVGITNSALNASLGLPIVNNAIGIPLPGVPPPVLGNSAINSGMGGSNMQGGMGVGMQTSNTGLPSFQPGGIPGMSNANVANSSLFLGQNTNNPTMGNSNNNNIGMPNHAQQSNIFPMHGLQHSGSQAAFGSSIYSNMMQQTPNQPPPSSQNVNDQWYYEDPSKNIQGPFLAKDMYNWYRAGFFSPSLMVRRACDSHMRPLGSYGPVVPFAQRDVLSSFSMSSGFDRPVGPHESILNSQPSLGLDSVDSLWSQPSPELWMQQALNARNESRVNNIFFWDHQPSNIASNTLLPEDITKEMKTEDQILAQLRASQAISSPQNIPFLNEQPPVCPPTNQLEETFSPSPIAASNLEELQKLLNKDALVIKPYAESITENAEVQQSKTEKITNVESPENITSQAKAVADFKPTKQSKTDNEKTSKNKENNNSKTKNKKKEEKKDDVESKIKEDDNVKTEKRSEESSPTKNKKEDKLNKKDLEKEKKEWLKEGFTIVKGPEKNASKDNKKKAEEAKVAEEVERKRKEDERLAAEEEKKRKQTEALRKQEIQQQKLQQRQAAESVVKKAPWSVVANQAMMATSKDGLTLTEIQKLEREKKLEQIKEQQQMMQIIAQQQAAALAREQEMQASLGWAKKKGTNLNTPGQSLNEIQAEARKQAALSAAIAAEAAAAAAVTQALDDGAPPPAVHIPWSNAPNGSYRLSSTKSLNSQPEYIDFASNSTPLEKPSGFWDTQPNQSPKMEKSQESPKAADAKIKKKVPVIIPPKKETTPAAEFDNWCNTVLASWSSKIDVPTFVAFLKDIESPYEVKDYVKCYLGESKDSNDFSRHFLERRSKLLRAGTVTPSDDLCSPAMAINPRTSSNSDYQEVKGKGKKTKKNKMLKVDARILGFSVTASEDRINVGDIDTV